MATIKDIALKANVSTATVSAVINSSAYVSPALKDRVTRALSEVDYHPDEVARSLKKKRTKTLGVIISDITNPFFTAVVRGVEDAANSVGYAVMLCNTDESAEKEAVYIRILKTRRIDGVILATASVGESYSEKFERYGIPVVFVNRVPSEPCIDAVVLNNFSGSFEAVSYLCELGHTRIGVITGLSNKSTTIERLKGYKEALLARGLTVEEELIRKSDSRTNGGYENALELLKLENRPSAIFVTNNLMTVGAMKAVIESGLGCPSDISIVGFDDFDWANVFSPRLTTVSQPTYEMGKLSVELLVEKIEGKTTEEPRKITLEPKLIIRESCAKLS